MPSSTIARRSGVSRAHEVIAASASPSDLLIRPMIVWRRCRVPSVHRAKFVRVEGLLLGLRSEIQVGADAGEEPEIHSTLGAGQGLPRLAGKFTCHSPCSLIEHGAGNYLARAPPLTGLLGTEPLTGEEHPARDGQRQKFRQEGS